MHDPAPLAIDPRPCQWCGLLLDRHHMVDNGEGPEFFCLESSDLAARLLAGQFENTNGRPFQLGWNAGIDFALRQIAASEDIAAIVAGWIEAADAPPVAPADPAPPRYRTPQATIGAFKYVVALGNVEHLKAWLAARPKDAPLLLAMLESPAPC
jgi:hypothetical protein